MDEIIKLLIFRIKLECMIKNLLKLNHKFKKDIRIVLLIF